ncbi:hypothetical protein GCM10022631_00170 [Deinococcus rubellus]|uniref:PP2C family serine/threonine-protein phosphatase n=1 Tax=Deinococcus rubellus TaxID=1889240 RepID=UPI0031E897D1
MQPWRYVHASVVGTAHQETGRPCQDSHAVKAVLNGLDEPLLLLITSDGAGSAVHAEEGSALACEAALHWLEMRLSDGTDFLQEEDGMVLVQNLKTVLENYSESREPPCALRDLACTLTVAAILPDRAWCLQVGDGAIVVQSPSAPFEVVFWPDSGEYANQTYFVTDTPEEHVHTQLLPRPLQRVALMTDGLLGIALSWQQRSAHAPFFEPMFQAVDALLGIDSPDHHTLQTSLHAFLESRSVNLRTSDDKTLILSSRVMVDTETTEEFLV